MIPRPNSRGDSLQNSRTDGPTHTLKSFNYSKRYSLSPLNSISSNYRTKIIETPDSKIALIELEIESEMGFPVNLTRLSIQTENNIEFLGFVGYSDLDGLVLPSKGVSKVIGKVSIDPKIVSST